MTDHSGAPPTGEAQPWTPPPKRDDAQCGDDCGVDEPYPSEILTQGLLCWGCGRSKPSVVYRLAALPDQHGEPTEAMVELGMAAAKGERWIFASDSAFRVVIRAILRAALGGQAT